MAKRLTEFGKTIRRIMESREIYHWSELHREIEKTNYPVSRQQIHNYVSGHSEADERFVWAIDEALNLNEDERCKLAYAWAFMQDRNTDPVPRTIFHKLAERFGWDEEEKQNKAYEFLFQSASACVA